MTSCEATWPRADCRPGLFVFLEGGSRWQQWSRHRGRRAIRSAAPRCWSASKEEAVEFVLLWFTDLEGHLKSFAITPAELEDALDDGMGFDGSSITGFNAIEESDMVAIPDPETFQLMPWKEGETKVARMICDVVTPDGKPYDGDPRYVLRRALDRMEAMGFDTFNVGPELEYFLFKTNEGTETLDEGGYFAMTTMDAATELRQRHDPRARVDGHPDRVLAPRGRPVAARDRHALRGRARHGRLRAHVPADRQGGRGQERRLRDLHAEADLRRERLGDAHAPVAVHATGATRSSTRTTSGTCPTSARRSSPASCGTRARSRRSSRSG